MLNLEKIFEEAETFLKDNKPINSMDFDFLYQNFEAALIDTD